MDRAEGEGVSIDYKVLFEKLRDKNDRLEERNTSSQIDLHHFIEEVAKAFKIKYNKLSWIEKSNYEKLRHIIDKIPRNNPWLPYPKNKPETNGDDKQYLVACLFEGGYIETAIQENIQYKKGVYSQSVSSGENNFYNGVLHTWPRLKVIAWKEIMQYSIDPYIED